jgi:hypothetical protein
MSTPSTPSLPPRSDQPQPVQGYAEQASPAPQPDPEYAPMPAYAGPASATGELGHMRPTGLTMLLVIVTFGIWSLVYYFLVFEEMRRHSWRGLGGVWALLIAIFFGVVPPYLLSNEVGQLYERRGQRAPVTALTGLWWFPGMLILVGPFIWFIRTNNALNDYWRSLGVRETSLV